MEHLSSKVDRLYSTTVVAAEVASRIAAKDKKSGSASAAPLCPSVRIEYYIGLCILTIAMLAIDVGYPVAALFHRLPEQTARACVHHVLPVYAPEILLAVLGVPATGTNNY